MIELEQTVSYTHALSDASLQILYYFIICLLIQWSVLKICLLYLLSQISQIGLVCAVNFSLTNIFWYQTP